MIARLLALLLLVGCSDDDVGIDAGPSVDASIDGTSSRDAGPDATTADASSDVTLADASPDVAPVELTAEVQALLSPLVLPRDHTMPPDPTNRFADDAAAARFGQRIFFDRGYSGRLLDGDNDGSENALGLRGESGRVACTGCHIPTDDFVDTRSLHGQISLAAGWVLRRTPTLLDVGHSELLGWGGRSNTFFGQFFVPLENPDEMNSSRLFFAEYVFENHRTEYEALFGAMPPLDDGARFPPLTPDTTGCTRRPLEGFECHGVPGDGAEFDGMAPEDQALVNEVVVNVGKAVGAYLRLLRCGPSTFDAWVLGESSSMSEEAKRGALLFAGDGQCTSCHAGPLLSDFDMHNVGLTPATVAVVFIDDDDDGAEVDLAALRLDPFSSVGAYSDDVNARPIPEPRPGHLGAFKTPSLRCVADRPSFMHTGQFRSLQEVLVFHNRGGHPFGHPGENELVPLGLTDAQLSELEAFLLSLEGEGPPEELVSPP